MGRVVGLTFKPEKIKEDKGSTKEDKEGTKEDKGSTKEDK